MDIYEPVVYAMQIKQVECAQYTRLLEHIPEERRRKISKFTRMEDALRTLSGEVLVRSLVYLFTNIKNEHIVIADGSHGKPYLRHPRHIYYNVSHSGEWVVCAVDSAEIGVDIEEMKDMNYLDIAKSYFSREEYADLLHRPARERLDYFYELWTLKESYVKNVGLGLRIDLGSFSIRKVDGVFSLTSAYNHNFYFKQYALPNPKYKLSICYRACRDHVSESIRLVDFEQLYEVFMRICER